MELGTLLNLVPCILDNTMQNSSTTQIASSLSHAFRQEMEKLPNNRANTVGTPIYEMQVDFMYALDAIQRGSTPEIEVGISTAKRLISVVRKANNS